MAAWLIVRKLFVVALKYALKFAMSEKIMIMVIDFFLEKLTVSTKNTLDDKLLVEFRKYLKDEHGNTVTKKSS